MNIKCHVNEKCQTVGGRGLEFASLEIAQKVLSFHEGLAGYSPTPLLDLGALASKLRLHQVLIKDERHRFGLNAFKVLGVSYAIVKAVYEHFSWDEDESYCLTEIIKHLQKETEVLTFITATDGNHGRALAWASQQIFCKAIVYMPKGSSHARLEKILSHGAQASILDVNYDATVEYAAKVAKEKGYVLVQDTAWPGYEAIPTYIMQGYFSLISEAMEQRRNMLPTHVFIQAGVGSLAAGIIGGLSVYFRDKMPKVVILEADKADCIYRSLANPEEEEEIVEGDLDTVMAGLACGKTSSIALPVFRQYAFAALSCSDDIAKRGMRILGNPLKGDKRIISGESGAVGIGALHEIMTKESCKDIRRDLGLDQFSSVFLISTEGDTDPENYRRIVWGD